ncbi:Dlgap5p [Halocaridina rubra]|uniref:Dlgap5p n=1 Tax=Halocaridina rubra TaxID=373956 RepID=A0AAN8X1D1_HALRR
MSGLPVTVEGFRRMLKDETTCLEQRCTEWRSICDTADIPQDVEGDILVAIGQAELLMRERFSQFSGLIDDCEFKRGERETTCQDLQGFWDIVYFQVEDVNKKFSKLSELRRNNWVKPKPAPIVIQRKGPLHPSRQNDSKPKVVTKPKLSGMRAHIMAARLKLKEAAVSEQANGILSNPVKEQVKKNHGRTENKENISPVTATPKGSMVSSAKSPEKSVFDAGFFRVVTPIKNIAVNATSMENCISTGIASDKVLSSAVLRERMRNSPVIHKDYSPCMRITRSMKAKGLKNRLHF